MKYFQGWKPFLKLCLEMETTKELDLLFDLFFTIEEKEQFASRLLIIQELLNGELTQREMAKNFSVSIAQISRGSNALKRIDSKTKGLLKSLIKDRR